MDGVSVLDMSNKKVSVLDSGVFPILKIENFLPEDEYEEVKKEVKSKIKELDTMIKSGWKPKFDEGRNFYRLYLDNLYKEDRSEDGTRLNSSHVVISYAVFCLKKKKTVQLIRQK